MREVLPEHTPNQGRQIWSENDQELLARLDSFALNVKSSKFGALGDGLADDLPALQSAIDACAQYGGGWVFLPPGTYLLKSGSLILRDQVNIFGAGMFNSTIRLSDGLDIPVLSDEGHSPNRDFAFGRVHLANFSIDGNKDGNPNGKEGLLTSAYFSVFENLLIHDCNTHGIRMGDHKLENASSQNRCSSTGRPGGHPSTTAPTALPCDSPQVVTRKDLPKVFPGMLRSSHGRWRRLLGPQVRSSAAPGPRAVFFLPHGSEALAGSEARRGR